MKYKFHSIVMCASVFCAHTVWGGDMCPSPVGWDGNSGAGGWVHAYNRSPETKPGDFVFCNAWIYDVNAPEENNSAKCHYTTKELRAQGCAGSNCEGQRCVKVSLNKPNKEINSKKNLFNGVARDQAHPGYHCIAESVESCIFHDGSSPGYKEW